MTVYNQLDDPGIVKKSLISGAKITIILEVSHTILYDSPVKLESDHNCI